MSQKSPNVVKIISNLGIFSWTPCIPAAIVNFQLQIGVLQVSANISSHELKINQEIHLGSWSVSECKIVAAITNVSQGAQESASH